jgi:predicted ribosomally synthesized peptide with nif11-like leader
MSKQTASEFLVRLRDEPAVRSRLGSTPTAEEYVEEGERAGLSFTPQQLRGVLDAERFFADVASDPVLAERLASSETVTAVLALVRETGYACDVEDLEAVHDVWDDGELSDQELDAVAGGFSVGVCKVPTGVKGMYAPVPYPSF